MQHAYFSASSSHFCTQQPQTILGHLAEHHAHDLNPLQRNAWLVQIAILQHELKIVGPSWIALEYAIPRMGKRADVVVLAGGAVFVVEFKTGSESYSGAALDQVTDYALDLKNFHSGSHGARIVPIVVATDAPALTSALHWNADGVAQPFQCNASNLGESIRAVVAALPSQPVLAFDTWASSGYKPTPTIIEAAQALYSQHRVEDITRSDAGAQNLSVTTAAIARIIETAKRDKRKAICFVTGVPGAGKTLAGLNLVTQRTNAHADEHAVFLSGNGPLVEVLREALARDEHSRAKESDEAQEVRRDAQSAQLHSKHPSFPRRQPTHGQGTDREGCGVR